MIDILLSTYNGEKYLKEQIDSVLSQTYTDWRLIVRDDGSTDGTLEILRDYTLSHSRITVLHSDGNMGVIKSFETLLSHSDADYFMFCDQDDVWLPTKIEDTLTEMIAMEQTLELNTPVMIHTDVEVVNSKLESIAQSFFKLNNLQPDLIHSNINYTLLYSCTTGCTLMGNAAARHVSLPFPDVILMHDNWVDRAVAMNGGKCVALHKATMLYRQHGGNVCGARKGMTISQRFQKQITDYKQYRLYVKHLTLLKYIFWKSNFYITSRWRK